MARAALLCGAALAALPLAQGRRAKTTDVKVGDGYIAVPGGLACPRDCEELTALEQCVAGARELGLSCNAKAQLDVVRPALGFLPLEQRLDVLWTLAGDLTMHGPVVLAVGSGGPQHLVGTEIVQVQRQGNPLVDVPNKTDEADSTISAEWEATPTGDTLTLVFQEACNNVTVVGWASRRLEFGGCSWDQANAQLVWNPRADDSFQALLQKDVKAFQQSFQRKLAVPGRGSDRFRICKCTNNVMPPFVAVMHSKCAPSCRRGFDPCSQHPGCTRITTWDTCKQAAQHMEWHFPAAGKAYTPTGGTAADALSVPEIWEKWNDNFRVKADWLALRGRTVVGGAQSPECTLGQADPCTKHPMWMDAEWVGKGLIGGEDRFCEFLNDTAVFATASPPPHTNNVQWRNLQDNSWLPLAPPPINYLGDPGVRVIPQQPEWSSMWTAPPGFLNAAPFASSNRPEGCTFDMREEEIFGSFEPWAALRLRTTPVELTGAQCCPQGTPCDVQNCTAAPCLDVDGALPFQNACNVQSIRVKRTFELCQCQLPGPENECEFYGQPCGIGQTCTDLDSSGVPPPAPSPGTDWQCQCDAAPSQTAMLGPVQQPACPQPPTHYIAVPSGRKCPMNCHRIVTTTQCQEAATVLGLADTTATTDPSAHRFVRPCGCHYSEHGARCTDSNGDCLRFNPTYGDGVYNGCDAYEPADAHDFMLCACDSLPPAVAVPQGSCPATCNVIVSKQDCRVAAEEIGMHLAVHEEQEALLLLQGSVTEGSKLSYPAYTGADGNTYLHHDDGLGPVVGDGQPRYNNRPAGCHYRRRYDADVLPAEGQSVNWPHLMFNPNTASGQPATTQDWLICNCSGPAPAPTPAPTVSNLAYATGENFTDIGAGRCTYAGIASHQGPRIPLVTFQHCIDGCYNASSCRAVEWNTTTGDVVDREGYGGCRWISYCSVSEEPCEVITAAPEAGYDFHCFEKIPQESPPPPGTPGALGDHSGDTCDSFCCQQKNRDDCCGPNTGGLDCGLNNSFSYCWWSGKNICDRNCFDRGGNCTEIEICFNVTEQLGNFTSYTPQQFSNLTYQIAYDANYLIGGQADAVEPVDYSLNLNTGVLTVNLKCPQGGCGSKQYIADSLCFSGADVAHTIGSAKTKVAVDGFCLKVDTVPTADQPKDNLAGLQPIRVTATDCNCTPPELQNTTQQYNNQTALWETTEFAYVVEEIVADTHSPAYTDSPPLNTLCDIPASFVGLKLFRTNYSVPFGTQFNISCPEGCNLCDVFLTHLHDPPCSGPVNGNWPANLIADGWKPDSCAPNLCSDSGEKWRTVAYRRRIEGGKNVVTPPVETACLTYFNIFAGQGVFCEDPAYQTEEFCAKAGPTCNWVDGQCVTDFCKKTPKPPPPPGNDVRPPGAPKPPHVCTPAPGAVCVDPPSSEQIAEALAKLGLDAAVSGGYKLLQSGQECSSGTVYLSTESSVAECAADCKRTPGCTWFIYGHGPHAGKCYWELTTDACATEGFEPNSYNFYTLTDSADRTGSF